MTSTSETHVEAHVEAKAEHHIDIHTTAGKLAELRKRTDETLHPVGETVVEKVHAKGKLTARERQQLSQTEPLANKPKNEAKTLAGLKNNEHRNQRSGEDLEQLVKRLGPQAAPAASTAPPE